MTEMIEGKGKTEKGSERGGFERFSQRALVRHRTLGAAHTGAVTAKDLRTGAGTGKCDGGADVCVPLGCLAVAAGCDVCVCEREGERARGR